MAFIFSILLIGNLGITSNVYADPYDLEYTRECCIDAVKCAKCDVELFLNLVERCSNYFKDAKPEDKEFYQGFLKVLNKQLLSLENLELNLSNLSVAKKYILGCDLRQQIYFRYNMITALQAFLSLLYRSDNKFLDRRHYDTIERLLSNSKRYFELWKHDENAKRLKTAGFYDSYVKRIDSYLEMLRELFHPI